MKNWGMFGLLGLIWGASFLLIKIGVQELSAFDLVTGRLGVAAICFALAFLVMRKQFPRDPKTLALIGFVGVINTVIPFLLITSGEQTIDSGLASVIDATVPLFSIVIAHYALRDDRITSGKALGLVTGFVGVIILASRSMDPTHPNPILGQLITLLASVFYACGAVLIRRYLSKVDPLITAGGSMITGAVVILLFTVLFEHPLPNLAALHTGTILAVITLGIPNTFIAYTIYFTLINNWGASRATMVTYLIPPVGLLLGTLANGEPLTVGVVIGAALIIGGVALANLRNSRSGEPADVSAAGEIAA